MKSCCHQNTRQLIAHYLCPPHLWAPVIKIGYRTRNRYLSRTLKLLLKGYDWGYRRVMLPVLEKKS